MLLRTKKILLGLLIFSLLLVSVFGASVYDLDNKDKYRVILKKILRNCLALGLPCPDDELKDLLTFYNKTSTFRIANQKYEELGVRSSKRIAIIIEELSNREYIAATDTCLDINPLYEICETWESCTGQWIPALDTEYCCDGNCFCIPDCDGKDCGDNGCGNPYGCGTWGVNENCVNGNKQLKNCEEFGVTCLSPFICLGETMLEAADTASCCPSPGTCEQEAICDDLKIYMKMDNDHPNENGDYIHDWSGNSNYGDSVGATWTSSGKFNGGYSFDGAGNYIRLLDDISFTKNLPEITLSAWIKPAVAIGVDRQVVIAHSVGSGTPTTSSRATIDLRETGDIYLMGRSTDNEAAKDTITPNDPLQIGDWNHLVGVIDYEGDTLIIYLDGAEIKRNNSMGFEQTSTPDTDSKNSAIGSEDNGGTFTFNGVMDEVAVWSKALSESEIQTIYLSDAEIPCEVACISDCSGKECGNDGCGGSCGECAFDYSGADDILHYNFDTPGSVQDITGNGNDIDTILGASYIANGLVNGAYDFTGTASGLIANVPPLLNYDYSTGFSVSVWVKPGRDYGPDEPDNWTMFVQRKDSENSENQFQLGYQGWSDLVTFSVQADSCCTLPTPTPPDILYAVGQSILEKNKWYHIVATLSAGSGEAKLFVDGVELGQGSGMITLAGGKRLGVGSNPWGTEYHFDGLIDEVVMFDKPLTLEEVQDIYQDGMGEKCSSGSCYLKTCADHVGTNCPSPYLCYGELRETSDSDDCCIGGCSSGCDISQETCENSCSERWSVGGESLAFGEYDTGISTECCGDDVSENFTYFQSGSGTNCDPITDGYCVAPDDITKSSCCNDSNDCYDPNPTTPQDQRCVTEDLFRDLDGDGTIDGKCMTSDSWRQHWRDCDSAQSLCDGGCGANWANGSETVTFGEYENGVGSQTYKGECCGDDPGEFYITEGPGAPGCCDSADDCIDINGACQSNPALCIDPLCEGLKLLYHFDNDPAYGESTSSAHDFSGNGFDGTIDPLVTYDSTNKKYGANSLDFPNSKDWVQTQMNMKDELSQFTLAAWAYPHAANGNERFIGCIEDSSHRIMFGFHNGDLSLIFNSQTIKLAESIPSDDWNHTAATYDGNTVRIYKNGGETINSNVGSQEMCSNTIRIGDRGNSGDSFWGDLDEVAIWNRALTQPEIDRLQTGPIPCDIELLSCTEYGGGNCPSPKVCEGNLRISSDIQDCCIGTCLDICNGLINNFHFDKNSAYGESNTFAYDFSGHANYGTVSGGSPYISTSKFGANSMNRLSGNANIADNNILNISNKMSIMAWIYPTQAPGNYDRIICKAHTSNSDPWSMFHLGFDDTGKVGFSVTRGGVDDGPTGTTVIPISTWTNVIGTYDGSLVKIYINGGTAEGQKSLSGDVDTNSRPIYIGVNQLWGQQNFDGYIDETAIWNRELTADEIAYLQTNPLPCDFDLLTCAEMGGTDCPSPSTCDGNLKEASDTNDCCVGTCNAVPGYKYWKLSEITNNGCGWGFIYEVEYYWEGSYQTNALTSNTAGNIGGVNVVNMACEGWYSAGTSPGCYGIYDGDISSVGWNAGHWFNGADYNQIQLASPINPTKIRVRTIDSCRIDTFNLKASNDGTNWNTIGTYTQQANIKEHIIP